LGYIDLNTIDSNETLDKAFSEFKDTDGLIFDMRGYPMIVAQIEVPKRISREPVKSAIAEIPIVRNYDLGSRSWTREYYIIQPHESIYFSKPIVVLINEKAQSMAEDVCINMKSTDRVTFVGSATAGTTGLVTLIHLPAGGWFSFTGKKDMFANGSRFQNIGVIPDVEAHPTIQGIKEGRDEVLEKGIEVLKELIAKNHENK
jgi:C-terminal processing protease CtpA/Prc